jgi:hypothetical protein
LEFYIKTAEKISRCAGGSFTFDLQPFLKLANDGQHHNGAGLGLAISEAVMNVPGRTRLTLF